MSIHIMAPVWKACPYEGKKLLVLLALCDFADAEGNCWPKMEQVKDQARCSIDYARDCIREFEHDGWVTTTVHHGRGKSNEYMIHKNPVSRRVSKTRSPAGIKPGLQPPSGLYNKPSLPPSRARGEKDQEQRPATAGEETGGQDARRESPPTSSSGNRGSGEIQHSHLSDQEIRRKMKKDGAQAWQSDLVVKSDNPTAAYYEWKKNGRLPDKQGRVHQYKTRAEQNLSDRDAAYEALERMKKHDA